MSFSHLTSFLLATGVFLETCCGAAPHPGPSETVVFLDDNPEVSNGSATYDPESRACGKGTYRVFSELTGAARSLAEADTLYIRAGIYSRTSVGKYITVHGSTVNYWTGALAITANGTPQQRKLVSAYQGESVIIQAKPGVRNYNPDPGDTSFKNSSHYYPNPAISISGAYVDVFWFSVTLSLGVLELAGW